MVLSSYELLLKEFTLAVVDSLAELSTFADEVEYQGFDPELILKKVIDALNAKYPKAYHSHVIQLCALAMLRGNAVSKIKNSIGDKHKTWLEDMIKILDLKDQTGSTDKKNTITLVRIAQSFPHISCKVAITISNQIPAPLGFAELKALPGYIKSPGFPAFLDTTDSDLKEAYVKYHTCLSYMIAPAANKNTFAFHESTVRAFMEKAISSNRLAQVKSTYLKELDVETSNAEIKTVVALPYPSTK